MVKVSNSLKVFRAIQWPGSVELDYFVPTDSQTDRQTDRQTEGITDNYLASHILGKNSYKNGQTDTKVTITNLV